MFGQEIRSWEGRQLSHGWRSLIHVVMVWLLQNIWCFVCFDFGLNCGIFLSLFASVIILMHLILEQESYVSWDYAELIHLSCSSLCIPSFNTFGNLICIQILKVFWESLIHLSTLQRYGNIDIVVSNAAANPTLNNILDTKETVLDKLWEINVKASVLLLQVGNW